MNSLRLHEVVPKESPNLTAVPSAGPAKTPPASTAGGEYWRYTLLGVAAVYVILSLYFIVDTRSRLAAHQNAQQIAMKKLSDRQTVAEAQLKSSNEALAQRLGMTEQELHARMQARATDLQRQQQALERRLQQQQKEQSAQKEQIGQVTGDIANVRTELGSAKTDIAATRTDLEATKVKLERAIGDLTGQGTLIARTRQELDELRRRGERNYYEFVLHKSSQPTAVSTVSLQLKRTNPKKSRFTLNVIADDRTIEKKDRGAAEPLQFYSGRDHLLYEVVIFTVGKNEVTGYLSTPKTPGAAWSRQ